MKKIKYFRPDIKYFRPDIKYFRLDTGKYTMLALNRTGEIWHSFNINVKGKKYKQLKGLFNNFYSAHNKTDFNQKWFNYCAALNIFYKGKKHYRFEKLKDITNPFFGQKQKDFFLNSVMVMDQTSVE